ncbi:Protein DETOXIFICATION 41 [Sarracenia purpurea var. burkii]
MDLEEDHRPLLPEDQASSVLSSAMVEAILSETPGPTGRCYIRLAGWESRLLWLLSGSSIIVSVCNYMLSFVTLTFSGHLGTLELAGASLAMVGTQGLAYGIMTPEGKRLGRMEIESVGIWIDSEDWGFRERLEVDLDGD